MKLVIVLCLKFYVVNSAIFLWSNREFDLSPLIPFDNDDLEDLVYKMHYPKVFKFSVNLQGPIDFLPHNIQPLTEGFYSAYNPNGHINASDGIVLTLHNENSKFCNVIANIKAIQDAISKIENDTSFIVIINIVNRIRSKRAVGEIPPPEENSTPQENVKLDKPEGPVIYKGQNKKDNLYALMYSSKPLMLKVNNSIKYLGKTRPDMITVDTRLNVNIPLDEGKVTLRFSFMWINGYWYLPSVKIITSNDDTSYNLTTDENIMAPAHFSYHCNGQSVFTDSASGNELRIYDLQVQIDSKDGKFGDANDCVSFTTAPIWSGLFVTTILGLGLIVALTAIMDIKTMDKFDNYKTKNLVISVSE